MIQSFNTMVFGAGRCFGRNYVPVFRCMGNQRMPITVSAVVDLESRRNDVLSMLSTFPLSPPQTIFVPDAERDNESLSKKTIEQLDVAIRTHRINAAVVVTPPEAHMAPLTAVINRNLKTLVEKPLCAPYDASIRVEAANQLLDDAKQVRALLQNHPQASLTVMAQRRYHPGFEFVRCYLEGFVAEFQVPISFIDIYYSDGEWMFPDEYGRENHPFRYGYGKLHHGGYHFIDQLSEVLRCNDRLSEKAPDQVEVYTHSRRPADLQVAITPADYAKFFPDGPTVPDQIQAGRSADQLGECDVFSSFAFRRGRSLITAAAIHLLHNGISRRSWRLPNPDTYKRNGRIRQEYVRIDVGPLLSIEVRSYEAHETEKMDHSSAARADVGWPRHFDVSIFRNSGVVGGEPYTEIKFGEENSPSCGAKTFVEEGRRLLIQDFFSNVKTRSDFESHLRTNRLMHLISLNLAKESQGEMPLSSSAWQA